MVITHLSLILIETRFIDVDKCSKQILGATAVKLENGNDDDPLYGSCYDGASNDDDESCGYNISHENRLDDHLNQHQGLKVSKKKAFTILHHLMGNSVKRSLEKHTILYK